LENPQAAAASTEPSEQADQTEPTESTNEFGEKTEGAEPNAYDEVSSSNGCEN
jgi:hypothetical protein